MVSSGEKIVYVCRSIKSKIMQNYRMIDFGENHVLLNEIRPQSMGGCACSQRMFR